MAYLGSTATPSVGREPIERDDPEVQRQIGRLHRRLTDLRQAFGRHEPDAARRARWLGRLDDMETILASAEPDLRGVERALDAIADMFPPTAPVNVGTTASTPPDDSTAANRPSDGWWLRLWRRLRGER